jgi:predicted HTH transcriptional regulator
MNVHNKEFQSQKANRNSLSLKLGKSSTPSLSNKRILDLIKKEKVVTSSEIMKLLKVSWNTADSYLRELLIEGKLIRIKKEGVNLWVLR